MKQGKRWRLLLHRKQVPIPAAAIAPLVLRTSWGDFAFRMRRAIDIDVRLILGEIDRAELARQQATRHLPTVDPAAPTVAMEQRGSFHEAATTLDEAATMPVAALR